MYYEGNACSDRNLCNWQDYSSRDARRTDGGVENSHVAISDLSELHRIYLSETGFSDLGVTGVENRIGVIGFASATPTHVNLRRKVAFVVIQPPRCRHGFARSRHALTPAASGLMTAHWSPPSHPRRCTRPAIDPTPRPSPRVASSAARAALRGTSQRRSDATAVYCSRFIRARTGISFRLTWNWPVFSSRSTSLAHP